MFPWFPSGWASLRAAAASHFPVPRQRSPHPCPGYHSCLHTLACSLMYSQCSVLLRTATPCTATWDTWGPPVSALSALVRPLALPWCHHYNPLLTDTRQRLVSLAASRTLPPSLALFHTWALVKAFVKALVKAILSPTLSTSSSESHPFNMGGPSHRTFHKYSLVD